MKTTVLGVVLAAAVLAPLAYIQAANTAPPSISNVKVKKNSDTSVSVTWVTDKKSDSLINFGLQPNYGIVRNPSATSTSHSITLDNLLPNQVYHFRVVSADPNGDQGISADYKFQTGQQSTSQSNSSSQSANQTPSVQKIQQEIKQITKVTDLKKILQTTQQAIQGITSALTIMGPPKVVPQTTTATVSWTTDRPSNSTVLFSPTSDYTPDNYSFSQSSTDGNTTDHVVKIIGLTPYTEYHFQVQSTDANGVTGQSNDYTFRTKASLPVIKNLRIVKVEETSATIAWNTNVPASALIEYQDMTTGQKNSVGRPTLATQNQLRISNLTLGTRYVAYVTAENAGGDRVKSKPIQFVTVKDTTPPIVSNVTNDSTIFPDDPTRIQTIVEWNTDEPAYCTLSYTEGVNGGNNPTTVNTNGISYSTKHVDVIVDFQPATVYQFWLNCQDQTGNKMHSQKYVLFTPAQQKSIIDLILQNFQSTFGWVKNITGKGASGG